MKQKVTVRQVADAFARPLISHNPVIFGKSAIEQVVDSLGDYSRRLSIYPAYKELKGVYKLFSDDRDKLIERLVTQAGEDPNEVKQVPPAQQPEFEREVDRMLSAEYEMRTVLRFTTIEVNSSPLPMSQWELIEPFANLKPLPEEKDK